MFRRAREVKRSRCCAFAHDALSLYSIPTKRSQASVSLFSPANNPLPSCTHCTCSRIIAHSCFISVCSPWSKPMGNYLSYSCRHGRNACQSPPCALRHEWPNGCGPNTHAALPATAPLCGPRPPANVPGAQGHTCRTLSKRPSAQFLEGKLGRAGVVASWSAERSLPLY
jgi:hypothetical protein